MAISFKTLMILIMIYKYFEYDLRKQSCNMAPIIFQGWRAGNSTYGDGQTRQSKGIERKGILKFCLEDYK